MTTPDAVVHCVHTNWEWRPQTWGSCEICETGQHAPLVQFSRHKSMGNGLQWLEDRVAKIERGEVKPIGEKLTLNGFHFEI